MPASLAQAYLGYFGAEGLAGLDAGQRSLIDAYQRVVSAAGTPAAFNDHTIATAYSAYVRAIADGTTSALSGATLAAYENYLRVLGGTQVLDAGQRAQIEAFQAVRAAGLSGASADLSNLLVSYLDHLARGGAATAFTGADGSALAAALAYLSVIGLPADFNAEPAARIAAFAEYIRAGGAIGSLPPTLNPNPNPSPNPNPNPDPQPEVPASTRATWIGGYGGDGYKIDVTLNQNGVPTAFGALKVGTARLLDSSRGAGWQVGRYGDGTMVQTYRGTETSTSYGPNDGLHFAFATSNVPLTLNTGSATYGIAGFTRPTYADASEVTAANLSGSLAVDFATLKAGIEAILTTSVAGTTQSYTMSSTGGIAAPSAGIYGSDVLATNIRVNVTSTDTARCATSCTGLFALAGSGANAEVVVGTYALSGAASILRGAAAFTQSTRSAPPPGAPSGTGLEYRGLGLGGNLIGFGAETVALGADGKLDLIDEWERGTATNNESGGLAGAIGWTRWAGGTIRTQNGRNTQDIAANNGRHLVWYRPLTNLPTSGSAGYSLIGGTAPTRAIANTAPGTLKSGALAVDFASMKVGIELAASVDGIDYTLGSRGGVAAPSAALGSNGRFGLNSLGIGEQIVMTGGGCTGPNCYGSIEGSLAGDGASHAAITYNFSTGTSGPQVQGVAAFGRD